MSDIALLASRYAARPLLLTPSAARDLALRIRNLDARAFERPSRLSALLRKVGLANGGKAGRHALAMDDDYDGAPAVPMHEQLAYSPRWLGDVEDTGYCWSLKDGIALMCCDTPLVERGEEFCGVVWHGYDTLLLGMKEALADARVKGVFLRLDTPGGVAGSGLPELAAFMRQAREAAGGKPIWVYADMACSAGYWIASSGDRIIAGRFGYVGSLGAVMGHENHAGALDQDGIEITTIEFPEGGVKTEGAWWKALSEAGRAAWQADVTQIGESFFADVTAGRPQLTSEAMMAMRADAFMAEHSDPARSGLALQLVDEIATEEAAFAALVAHVSDPAEQPPAAAPGARASASTPKERPMATRTQAGGKPTRAAQVAQAEKAFRLAQANLNRVRAGPVEGDEDEDETSDAPDSAEQTDAPTDTPAEDDDDEEETDDDAKAIAASPEAKTHPGLALAAIQSGQTLAQFKANVGAPAPAKASRLDRLMASSPRLGGDAPQGGVRAGMQSAVQARITRNREATKASA